MTILRRPKPKPLPRWQLHEAKARLSELIDRAQKGPQMITRHGREQAVILSVEEFRTLSAQQPDFRAHLLGGPKADDFNIERDRGLGRTIEF